MTARLNDEQLLRFAGFDADAALPIWLREIEKSACEIAMNYTDFDAEYRIALNKQLRERFCSRPCTLDQTAKEV